MNQKSNYNRLESLDILRGFDLFCLTLLEPLLRSINNAAGNPAFDAFYRATFQHVDWFGFSFWDLVMPLFMFMAGVSMPFAFSGYFKGTDSAFKIHRRVFKRFVMLFVLGMIVQGNLLAFDLMWLRPFSNTLQAIAVGYLFSALIIMHVRSIKDQVGITAGLLVAFWAVFSIAGDATPEGNIAEAIDRAVLGRFRDGVYWEDKVWLFSDNYRYAWILSSLNFVATVMTGYFAGLILKSKKSEKSRLILLFSIGASMVLVAYLWSFQHPIIKKVWSSSMVLHSSGLCFLLMGLFYWLIDVRGYHKPLSWLKPYGMNSILIYMLAEAVNIRPIFASLLFGLEQWTGAYQGVVLVLAQGTFYYWLLFFLYKHKYFWKV